MGFATRKRLYRQGQFKNKKVDFSDALKVKDYSMFFYDIRDSFYSCFIGSRKKLKDTVWL